MGDGPDASEGGGEEDPNTKTSCSYNLWSGRWCLNGKDCPFSHEESEVYKRWHKLKWNMYKTKAKDLAWNNMWMWLSTRCSIEYCEALAIADSLRDILLLKEEKEKKRKTVKRGIKKIRIITDSQTMVKMVKK